MMTVTLNWATRQMLTFLKLKVKKNLPFYICLWPLQKHVNPLLFQIFVLTIVLWRKKINKYTWSAGMSPFSLSLKVLYHSTLLYVCMLGLHIYRLLHYPPCSHTISLTPHHTHREYLLLYTHSHNLNPVPERKINYFWKQ